MIDNEKPIAIAVHPKLKKELDIRKSYLEFPGRTIRGGLNTISKLAGFELESIRESGEEIKLKIDKMKQPKLYKFNIHGEEIEFVDYAIYKKLFIFTSILNRKKDQKQINVELTKIRGLKKNEANIYW